MVSYLCVCVQGRKNVTDVRVRTSHCRHADARVYGANDAVHRAPLGRAPRARRRTQRCARRREWQEGVYGPAHTWAHEGIGRAHGGSSARVPRVSTWRVPTAPRAGRPAPDRRAARQAKVRLVVVTAHVVGDAEAPRGVDRRGHRVSHRRTERDRLRLWVHERTVRKHPGHRDRTNARRRVRSVCALACAVPVPSAHTPRHPKKTHMSVLHSGARHPSPPHPLPLPFVIWTTWSHVCAAARARSRPPPWRRGSARQPSRSTRCRAPPPSNRARPRSPSAPLVLYPGLLATATLHHDGARALVALPLCVSLQLTYAWAGPSARARRASARRR